jgi:hypothetical protein
VPAPPLASKDEQARCGRVTARPARSDPDKDVRASSSSHFAELAPRWLLPDGIGAFDADKELTAIRPSRCAAGREPHKYQKPSFAKKSACEPRSIAVAFPTTCGW